ncbi:MAG: peptide deformylase [Eubacteriales bacterium]
MEKPIVHDVFFLSLPSDDATPADISAADDLLDTLSANSERCVGMAANMIGIRKNIIVFRDGELYTVMFNPQIIKRSGKYDADEGCLSLDGTRRTSRFKTIKVEWQTRGFEKRVKSFSGWTAQIIQHEIDHLHGIII